MRTLLIRGHWFLNVTLLVATATTQAADIVNLSVEIDGWTMTPIVENGATTHIIATRNDDETLTTDVDVVLYERTANGWAGTAYDPSVTKEDAVLDLADEFGLPDPFGGKWHIDLDADDVLGHVLPRVGFGKGFFVTDPLYVIAHQLNDPEPLAEAAENSGLPAGSSAINTGSIGGGAVADPPQPIGSCCDVCLQDSIAAGVDASLSDPTLDLDAIELIAYAESQSQSSCCWPWTWTTSTTETGCTGTGPWVLFDSDVASLGSGYQLQCRYRRPVTDTQTRNRIRRCADCTRIPFSQSRTRTGEQRTIDSYEFQSPPAPTCPAVPAWTGPCNLTRVLTQTAWTPAPPACP